MVAAQALGGIGSRVSWPMWKSEDEVSVPLSSEARLARSAAQGHREAFGRLVEEHKRAVYGLCLRILSDPEEARDAAQEAFARPTPPSTPSTCPSPSRLGCSGSPATTASTSCVAASPRAPGSSSTRTPEGGPAVDLADPEAERGDERLERPRRGTRSGQRLLLCRPTTARWSTFSTWSSCPTRRSPRPWRSRWER